MPIIDNRPGAGGGGGGVTSVNGDVGPLVVITKANIGLGNVTNTSDANKPVSTAQQTAIDLKQEAFTGTANGVAGFDAAGEITSIDGFSISTITGGLLEDLPFEPDNNGYVAIKQLTLNVRPLQNSPNESIDVQSYTVELDQSDSGFSQGDSGTAVTILNNNINHSGSGDVGDIVFIKNFFSLGNGVDPIEVKGISYSYGFGDVNANVTILGAIQGYGFQPNVDALAILVAASYINAFYDFAIFDCDISNYTSFTASPTIAGVQNNRNYTAFNANPNITEFIGNANFSGFSLTPIIDSFDTGYFVGININPTVNTGGDNSTGMRINMSGVSATNVKAMDITGNVSINGDLSFTGALSIGQLNAFYEISPVINGGGIPTTVHSLISAVVAANGVTTANCDTIGVNTAMLVTLEDNSVNTSGGFGLGFTALALPCVVITKSGSTLDYMSGATFALSFDGTSTGGTIGQTYGGRAVVIPNGITTLNRHYGWFADLPFGDPADDSWGFYESGHSKNFMSAPLKIGGADVPEVGFDLDVQGNAKIRGTLTVVGGIAGNTAVTYKYVLQAADIAAKEITLPSTPLTPSDVTLDVIGGIQQGYTTDFTVTGNVLSWDTLGYETIAEAGDSFVVVYKI